MRDAATLLFGLEGFRVVRMDVHDEDDPGARREVLIEGAEDEQACPDCGVLSGAVHARKVRVVKNLPHGRRPLRVRWDQRRWACRERACRRRTFAETSVQVRPGQRLTRRLRGQLEQALSGSTPSAADVAREFAVSWWSVNTALVVVAAAMLPRTPAGVWLLGVDETRARSVRWLLSEHGWRRTDPWMTSFVDLDPAHPGGLLGLAPGRSGARVRGWLDLQSKQFRDGIEVVAVDPSAPFAAALSDVLPHATLVVDHWHLHRLANLMLTQVRQRTTQQAHGHRGRASNDSWAYRRLLMRGARHLSDKQWAGCGRCSPATTRPVRSRRRGPARISCVSSWTRSPRPAGRWSSNPAATPTQPPPGPPPGCVPTRSGRAWGASTTSPHTPASPSSSGSPGRSRLGLPGRPDHRAANLLATGFIAATNLAVSPDGTVYVAELFGDQISRIFGGTTTVLAHLPSPAAVVWVDDKLYASADALGPQGRIVRISLERSLEESIRGERSTGRPPRSYRPLARRPVEDVTAPRSRAIGL